MGTRWLKIFIKSKTIFLVGKMEQTSIEELKVNSNHITSSKYFSGHHMLATDRKMQGVAKKTYNILSVNLLCP